MASVKPELWSEREWNKPNGRLAWWARHYRADPSEINRLGLMFAWSYCARRLGELACRQVYRREKLPIPCFLVAGNKPSPPSEPASQPIPAVGVIELPLFGYARTHRRIALKRAA